jgi:AAA+ superfamily predicted ATPase
MDLWSVAAEMLDPQKLKNNQFVTAAIIAAPATAITYALRSVPAKIWSSIKRATTITLRFNSDMGDYEAISRFVTKHVIYEKFSRNFNYQTETKWDSDSCSDKSKHLGLTAGYGNHIGFYRRRLVMVNRHIDEGNQTAKFKEHLVLTFFGGRKLVHQFAAEIMKKAGSNFGEFTSVPVWINSGNWWNRAGSKPLRKLNSVFTSGGAGRRLYQAVREFEAKRAEHHRLGLPHHLGILLFGVPGCGKSSLIHALASELERSIFYLNLGSVESDKELTDLVTSNRDWSQALLVLEDFDAAGVAVNRDDEDEEVPVTTSDGLKATVKRKRSGKKKDKATVTLSTMLNVLDGLISPDGLVVIATTNHPEKLDDALKREGRFDQQYELGRLGYDEFVEMCDLFGVEPDAYPIERGVEMTGAAMRAMIINPQKVDA